MIERTATPAAPSREDEWLWGWDPTPGIVSVWARLDGRAFVWRRDPESGELIREDVRFRPWLLLSSLRDLEHLGQRLQPESDGLGDHVSFRELQGPGALRFVVHARDGRSLRDAVLRGASRRLGRPFTQLKQLGAEHVLSLAPEEQYLVASGRNYFRELGFDALQRLQFDLETSGLDPERDCIFLVAVRAPDGSTEVLEASQPGDGGEAELIRALCARIVELDPDVIENHNLHGFDLPFLSRRAEKLRVPLQLARLGGPGFQQRPAARGRSLAMSQSAGDDGQLRRMRFTLPGRELLDSMDAVRRYDFASRDLPSHGLKAVARHLGLASEEREYVPGRLVHEVYQRDPERVRRYACDDVIEAAGVARTLGGSAFALARMTPRRYERLADAGPATGVLDPLLVRAYLRSGEALPAHEPGDGTSHSGAALHLFASGVARQVVKADVASLYPSLMRQYQIGPQRDRLGALLAIVGRLVDQRLLAKRLAKEAPAGSAERHTQEAMSAAMKIVVNSAYGYLGAVGLTRFADVHAANEVTRHGRELLHSICSALAERGVTLLEADTDGVYFAAPPGCSEQDERRIVAEVAALLPERVKLELDGRYAAMLSHEPKNYALKPYAGPILLRGVAFRSSRAEPFGEDFLRRALRCLLNDDVAGVRQEYVSTVLALRRRELPTFAVSAKVRLTKTPEQYLSTRAQRRELPYEAMLGHGRPTWSLGERVRVYRAQSGRAGLLEDEAWEQAAHAWTLAPSAREAKLMPPESTPRDYAIDYYLHVLLDTFAARLSSALRPEHFAQVFADPMQGSLFEEPLTDARPILTVLRSEP